MIQDNAMLASEPWPEGHTEFPELLDCRYLRLFLLLVPNIIQTREEVSLLLTYTGQCWQSSWGIWAVWGSLS